MAVSRQRKWQIKQNKKRLCSLCAKELSIESKAFCQQHLENSRRIALTQWRVSRGNPVDAPTHSSVGRPRGIAGPKLPKEANALMGTMKDCKIAKLYNVSDTTIHNRRKQLGIARFQIPKPIKRIKSA